MTIRMRSLAIVLALGFFAGIALADKGKSYRITLTSDSQIGSQQLPAGDYKLTLQNEEPKVRLADAKTGEELKVTGNVELAEEKFDSTEVHCDRAEGANRITEIRLGGTKTKVVFQR